MMEENAQMSLLPDVAAVTQNAAQMTLTGEEIDLRSLPPKEYPWDIFDVRELAEDIK